jgi:hypothetical protein
VPDLDTDTGTGKEGDVEARCFSEFEHHAHAKSHFLELRPTDRLRSLPVERDSPRDQLVVTCFILIVVGLLLTAAIRNR